LLAQLAEKIDRADQSIAQIARENEACRRLVAMPGVGPVTATAIIATIGTAQHSAFKMHSRITASATPAASS